MKNSPEVVSDDEEDTTAFYEDDYQEMTKMSPVRSGRIVVLRICSDWLTEASVHKIPIVIFIFMYWRLLPSFSLSFMF